MAAPYRVSIGVSIDPSAAKTGSKESINAVTSIAAAADRARPSVEKLISSFVGLDRQGANNNGRAADIAAYGAALDKLQAKFDPLFAAQKRYQATVEAITEAERVGAISASAAIDLRAKERVAIEGLIAANDRLAASRKRAAETMVARATVTPDRETDIAAYGAELDRLRARYNPLYATIVNYRSVQADIREAHKLGAISADEMSAALSRQRQATLAVIAAQKGRDTGAGASSPANDRFRRQNMSYQVFDVLQTASMGMPLSMIAAQQGPQILQLYAGQGGINTALKDFGSIVSGVTRLITPLTVGIGGLAAATTLGLAAWNSYLVSTKEVATAATGLGRAVAGSRDEMEAAAQAGASAAGISVSSARSMEAQFLRTGRIGSDNFESLIAISKDFGATFGVTAAEASTMLADMFADPAKAADTLFQKYGLIDAATARHASNLAAQNRQSEAQAVLLKALPDQLANASEATTSLGRAWEFVARNASNAFDNVGNFLDRRISGPTLEEQIAEAEAAQKRLSSGLGFLDLLNPANATTNANAARLEELRAQKRRQDAEAEERNRRAEDNRRSVAAVSLYEASPANARALQEQRLRNDIATLESARDIGGIDAGQNEAAIEAKRRALDALVNIQSRAIELDRLDIQIANERNPLLRAELEARRARVQMAAEEKSAADIEIAAGRARNRVIEETIAGAKAQVADMQAELEARARLNSLVASGAITASDANRMLQEELTLRPLIAGAALAEGDAKLQLEHQIASLRDGYAALAEQQKLASAQEYLRGNQEQLEQLRLQQSLIGENVLVQERTNALLEAEQRIRREGLDTNGNMAKAIRDQADALATLNRQVERQAEAWDKVKSSLGSAIDEGVDKLTDGDLEGALESVADEVKGLLSELAFKNPIKNALLGSDNPTISDVGGIGGIFSRLFGRQPADPKSLVGNVMGQSVGTMSVTAASVVVNGGMGGAAGSLTGLMRGAANDNSNILQYPGGTTISNFARAIKSIESGGNYSALGPLTAKGDRAYGAYQVMGANIPSWTKQALGQSLTPQQFLGNSNAQDAVFNKIFGGYASKFGASGAAQAWFGGPGSVGRGAVADQLGTTGAAYVQKFNAALGNATTSTDLAAKGLGNLGTGFDQFGRNLSSFSPASSGGAGGGGFFSNLLGGLFGGGKNFFPAAPAWGGGGGSGIGLYADGGSIVGPGGPRDDAVPIWASNGEFMVNARAAARYRPWLEAINSNRPLQAFADGGAISSIYSSAVRDTGAVSTPQATRGVVINNYSSNQVEHQEENDGKGGRQDVFTISEAVSTGLAARGGAAQKQLGRQYGLRRRGIAR
ncbi:hypothetical protein A6U97_12010 [Agrobacterium tumefaciens]|uniref:phage tail length tape measure family protein n=1 Tax=Agrobacterium tumefaciens TaxID=358 RepID=UPI00080FB238|nr:hypothetical protein A6U97_12010 [Agrobacterium tumefaciens]